MQTLTQQLDAFMDGLLERTDPATAAVMREATRTGMPGAGPADALRAGDLAPEFSLPDQNGAQVSLRELLARGPVVLTFFRGGWCPFCTIALRALDGIRSELRRQGAEVAAISPQRLDLAVATAERNGFQFPVLTDHGNAVARRYGLLWELGPEMRAVFERLGHPLPAMNAAHEWSLPVPAGFVIAPDGRVAYAHVDARITRRLDPRAALDAVRDLRARDGVPAE